MSIKLGSSSVSKLYIGTNEATKAYLGSDLIADTNGGGGGDEFVLQLGGLNLQLGGQDLTLGA